MRTKQQPVTKVWEGRSRGTKGEDKGREKTEKKTSKARSGKTAPTPTEKNRNLSREGQRDRMRQGRQAADSKLQLQYNGKNHGTLAQHRKRKRDWKRLGLGGLDRLAAEKNRNFLEHDVGEMGDGENS